MNPLLLTTLTLLISTLTTTSAQDFQTPPLTISSQELLPDTTPTILTQEFYATSSTVPTLNLQPTPSTIDISPESISSTTTTCTQPCMDSALSSTYCGFDTHCVCSAPSFLIHILSCLQQLGCPPDDNAAAVTDAAERCRAVGVELELPSNTFEPIQTSITSTPSLANETRVPNNTTITSSKTSTPTPTPTPNQPDEDEEDEEDEDEEVEPIPEKKPSKKTITIIVCTILGLFALSCILAFTHFLYKRNQKRKRQIRALERVIDDLEAEVGGVVREDGPVGDVDPGEGGSGGFVREDGPVGDGDPGEGGSGGGVGAVGEGLVQSRSGGSGRETAWKRVTCTW